MTTSLTREQLESQNQSFQQYLQDLAALEGIVREMKEIPELPSERPSDVNPLVRVEFPDKGGVLAYMKGQDYPYKGFPSAELVQQIDTIKKINRAVLSSFFHSLKAKKWKLLLIPFFFNELSHAFLYSIYRIIQRFRIKPIRHCDAIRELHRSFSIDILNEKASSREIRFMVRDVICMFLEFDNAYRYRFQDIIENLDKESLNKNPRKEIVRLMRLMQSREKQQDIQDTWTLAIHFISLLLLINRRIKKDAVLILNELNLDEVELKIEDKPYCASRNDYVFGFTIDPTPEEKVVICRSDARKDRDESKSKILKESDLAHMEVYRQVKNDQPTEEQKKELTELDLKFEALLVENEKIFQEKLKVCQ